MPRNTEYQFRFSSVNGWRYMLSMRPAQTGTPNMSAVTFAPEELDNALLSDTLTLSTRFPDTVPIGLQESGELTLKFRLDGTNADFVDYILNPSGTAKYLRDTIYSVEFQTSNFWSLKSDFGDSEADESAFVTLFQGAQRVFPYPTVNVSLSGQTCEITIVNLAQVLLEKITPEMLQSAWTSGSLQGKGGSIYPTWWRGLATSGTSVVDHWYDTGGIFGRVMKSGVGANGETLYLITISTLFDILQKTASILFCGYYSDGAFFNFSGVTTQPKFLFYTQTGTANHTHGATVELANMKFIAEMSDGEPSGGWFYNDFAEYNNAWDFLKRFSENFVLKTFIRPTSAQSITAYFRAVEFSAGQFIFDKNNVQNSDLSIEMGAEQFRAVTVNIKGVGSDDSGEIEVKRIGSLSENDFSLDAVFSVNPTKQIDAGGYVGADYVFSEELTAFNKLYIHQVDGLLCLPCAVIRRDGVDYGQEPSNVDPLNLLDFHSTGFSEWQENGGIGQVGEMILQRFGSALQHVVEYEVNQTDYDIGTFGASVFSDIATDYGAGYLSNLPVVGQVVELETDLKAGKSTVKVFSFE